MEDMDLLIYEVKKRNIKIIMDLVVNYILDEYEWFIELKSDINYFKRDWYIWRNGRKDGVLFNNWKFIFGGLCWEYDE